MDESNPGRAGLVIDWVHPPTAEPHPEVVWRVAPDPGGLIATELLSILFAPRPEERAA